MTDYTTGTGSGGTMMIRDTGGNIEFWIKAGFSSTFVNGATFTSYINGGWSGNNSFNYPSGGNWLQVATYYIGTSQSVAFHLNATGTSGLGGPTDLWASIGRATVPPAPNPTGFPTVLHTSITHTFASTGDGGSGILEWQTACRPTVDDLGNTTYISSNGTVTFNNLTPGVIYYFWDRGRNAVGWGPWNARTQQQTLAGLKVKVGGVWKDAVPYVKVAGVWVPAVPYVKVAGVWKATTN